MRSVCFCLLLSLPSSMALAKDQRKAAKEESPTEDASPADPVQTFEENALWFEDWVSYNVSSGAIVGRWAEPLRGKYREPLGWGEFYNAVGREDYADQYNEWVLIKYVGYGVGVAGLLGGLWLFGEEADAAMYGEEDTNLSMWVFGGGTVVLLVAYFLDPHPAEMPEIRRLADEYNQNLKRELGLTDDQLSKAPEEPEVELLLGPLALPNGGGVQMSVIF